MRYIILTYVLWYYYSVVVNTVLSKCYTSDSTMLFLYKARCNILHTRAIFWSRIVCFPGFCLQSPWFQVSQCFCFQFLRFCFLVPVWFCCGSVCRLCSVTAVSGAAEYSAWDAEGPYDRGFSMGLSVCILNLYFYVLLTEFAFALQLFHCHL